MREQNLIEATSDQQVSRLIQYLDPIFRKSNRQSGAIPTLRA
jgi:hypothetical protein